MPRWSLYAGLQGNLPSWGSECLLLPLDGPQAAVWPGPPPLVTVVPQLMRPSSQLLQLSCPGASAEWGGPIFLVCFNDIIIGGIFRSPLTGQRVRRGCLLGWDRHCCPREYI